MRSKRRSDKGLQPLAESECELEHKGLKLLVRGRALTASSYLCFSAEG